MGAPKRACALPRARFPFAGSPGAFRALQLAELMSGVIENDDKRKFRTLQMK